MLKPVIHSRVSFSARAHQVVDGVLRIFAYYVIPIGIGLISLIALVFWQNQYSVSDDAKLSIQVVAPDGPALAPVTALARLKQAQPVTAYDTRL